MSRRLTGAALAEAVLDLIRRNPERHYQGAWMVGNGNSPVEEVESCGTAACLAGWAVILNGVAGESIYAAKTRLAKDLGVPAFWDDVAARLFSEGDPDVEDTVSRIFYVGTNEFATRELAGLFGLSDPYDEG